MPIITIPKLKEYQRFDGDDDTMARTPSYNALNDNEDWSKISRLIGNPVLVQKGTAALYTRRPDHDHHRRL
jgi:hypothetical protein